MPAITSNTPSSEVTRMRATREEQGLSLRELAYFTGVSHTTVHGLERGTLDASPAIRARIARALRVSVAELWPAANRESAP